MVTPFDDEGAVDYTQARRLAAALVASGSEALVVSGTTGETPTLTTKEKVRLYTEVKAEVGGKAKVIAGATNYCTAESIEQIREAEHAGADGILATVPYYNKPPQEGLYRHFAAIAGSTNLPVLLYNVPSRTVTNMAAETTIRLSQIPNIAGVKEASANYEQIARIIAGARPGFQVWSGNDSDTLPILAMGGYGIVSVASHLVGKQIQGMIAAFLAGDRERAAAEHRRLLPIVDAMFIVSNPIPLKYALNKVGFRVGKPRLPLVELDAKSAAVVDAVLKDFAIDLPL
jgi:4-hydroxy-tetrahydrodipicolinate synthase